MELRNDLELILLNGLPATERAQTLRSMEQATVDKLRQSRASIAREASRDEIRQARPRRTQPPQETSSS